MLQNSVSSFITCILRSARSPFLHGPSAGEVGISRSGLKPDYFWGIFESSMDLIPGIVKYHTV